MARVLPVKANDRNGWKAAAIRISKSGMAQGEYWVAYDYGMGGVWAVACASSEAELVGAFPELTIATEPPPWMTPDVERKLRSVGSFVVGQPDTYPNWLRTLIAEREQ